MLSIKSLGFVLLLGYALYNLLNILVLHNSTSSIYILICIGALYFVVKLFLTLQNRQPISQSELIAVTFIFSLICIVIAQNIIFEGHVGSEGVNTTENVTALTTVSVLWFFVGAGSSQFEFRESAVASMAVALTVVGLMLISIDENLTIPYALIKQESGVENISHLTLEKHVILLLLFSYAMAGRLRFISVAIGTVSLFFMGGRTALFVYLLTALVMNLRGNVFRNTLVSCAFALLVVLLFLFGVVQGFIDADSTAVREILFLDGVEDDGSYQARIELLVASIPLLANQFWIGNFALVSEIQGGLAGYAHNLVSAWQFYGFFMFCGILFCLYYALRRMVFAVKSASTPSNIFGAYLLIYVLISVLFSKYVGWHLLWFVLGYWLLKPTLSKKISRKRKRRTKISIPSIGSESL